jgi:hypothetical protein
MAIENPVFKKVQSAIAPIISVGVGSAICSVCSKKGLNPQTLEQKDIPVLKSALVEHYSEFWAQKINDIKSALARV